MLWSFGIVFGNIFKSPWGHFGMFWWSCGIILGWSQKTFSISKTPCGLSPPSPVPFWSILFESPAAEHHAKIVKNWFPNLRKIVIWRGLVGSGGGLGDDLGPFWLILCSKVFFIATACAIIVFRNHVSFQKILLDLHSGNNLHKTVIRRTFRARS